MKTDEAVLYVNLGTPNSPEVPDVKKYLKEFLMDPLVIDIPKPLRFLLVNGIIAPFRSKKSSAAYKMVWTPEGSPLMVHSKKFVEKLKQKLPVRAELAMRYGQPSIEVVMQKLQLEGVKKLYIFTAYPQYALSSTESVFKKVKEVAKKINWQGEIKILRSFEKDEGFCSAFAKNIEKEIERFNPDFLLFSYHGLPIRHVKKIAKQCQGEGECSKQETPWNQFCYRRQCYASTNEILKKMKQPFATEKWAVSFQSRLSGRWIKPFSDEFYQELPAKGVKRLLVVCPSFTADCLETLEEVAMRGLEDFCHHGGEDLRLVPCLNSSDDWVDAAVKIYNQPAMWSSL